MLFSGSHEFLIKFELLLTFRCAASALPVLDGVVDYLPSPLERNQSISSVFGDHLSALIFKVFFFFKFYISLYL